MARALAWMERAKADPDAVSAAIRTTDDPEEARIGAFALRRVEAVDALAAALDASVPAVRAAVLASIATLPAPAPILEARLAVEPVAWLRRALARALLAARPDAAESLVVHADPGVRAEALSAAPTTPAWIPHLEAAARAPAPEVAWWGCIGLRRAADPTTVDALDAACTHDDPCVVAQAARGLVTLGLHPDVDVPGLHDDLPTALEGVLALDDRVEDDVHTAARAWRLADDVEVIRALLGRLAASDLDVARDAVVAATTHPVEGVREVAVRALDGRTGEAVWRAYLRRVSEAPTPEARVAAVWTVARRREAEALPLVLTWAAGPRGPVREAAVEGLRARVRKTARARTDAARDVLLARLDDGSPAERRDAAAALGRFGAGVAPALRRHADDPDCAEEVRASLERLGA